MVYIRLYLNILNNATNDEINMCFFYFLLGMFSIIFFLSLSLGHVPKVGKKQSEIILLWEVLLTLKVQAEFWLVYFYLEMFCSGTKSRLYFYLQRKKKCIDQIFELVVAQGGSKALKRNEELFIGPKGSLGPQYLFYSQ